MATNQLLVSSPFLINSSERTCEWAVLTREFSRLPQMESLPAGGVFKTRGWGRARGPGPGSGSIFFLGLRLVSTLPLTNPNPKTAFFKKERPRLWSRSRPRL